MPILTVLMPFISKLLDFIPDPALKAQQLQQIVTAIQQLDTAQSDIDKAEASNANVFVSGWRPCIGWVCAFAVAYQFIVMPLLTWAFAATHTVLPKLPGLDDNLWQLIWGMLGMSGLRTIEKFGGVTLGGKK